MDEREKVMQAAYRFLDFSQHTRWEVRRKLRQSHHDDDVIEEAINNLERMGLLNDVLFSERWIEYRFASKGYGKVRLEAELRQKGVDTEIIHEALKKLTEEEEITQALFLARKQLSTEASLNIQEKRKLFAFLQRRGYNTEIIEKVFTLLRANND